MSYPDQCVQEKINLINQILHKNLQAKDKYAIRIQQMEQKSKVMEQYQVQQKNQHLTNQVIDLEDENKMLKDQTKQLQSTISILRNKLNQSVLEYEDVKLVISQFQLNKKIDDMQRSRQKLESQSSSTTENKEETENEKKINEQAKQIKELQAQVKQQQATIMNMNIKFQQQEKQNQQKIQELTSQLKQKDIHHDKRVNLLLSECQKKSKLLEQLKKTRGTVVYNFEELQLDLEDANTRIEELEAQLDREEITHSEIIEQLQREKDQKIEELQLQMIKTQEKEKQLKRINVESSKSIEQLKKQLKSLQDNMQNELLDQMSAIDMEGQKSYDCPITDIEISL